MIEIIDLNKTFDGRKVLEDINLIIPEESIFGLIGINGAGKSTLLRLLSGVYTPDSGTIRFDGKDIRKDQSIKQLIFFYQMIHFIQTITMLRI